MASDNLIPFNKLTKEEQREKARMGGIASGRARRRKKQFRDELELLLPVTDVDSNGTPIINHLTGKRQSIQQTITMQLLLKARRGDIRAIKLILETLGERLLRTDSTQEVTLHQSRYDNMTDEELIAESKRLYNCINNV